MPAGTPDRVDWLFGTGATRTEKALVWATAVAATAGVVAYQAVEVQVWSWWQTLLAVAVCADVAGGVVANALDPNKRTYHGPPPARSTPWTRLLRSPLGFTALHVHPVVVALLVPGAGWWWGPLWYVWALVGVAAVTAVERRLQRPAAFAAVTLAAVVAPMTAAPAGFAWFPMVFLLKLVAAHAVPERAGEAPAGDHR